MALIWANEIHIDASLKENPILPLIIAHEKKHFEYLIPVTLKSISRLQLFKIVVKNNLWDFCSCTKLGYLLAKQEGFKGVFMYFAPIVAIIVVGILGYFKVI